MLLPLALPFRLLLEGQAPERVWWSLKSGGTENSLSFWHLGRLMSSPRARTTKTKETPFGSLYEHLFLSTKALV
jgi:hypothetical protein